MRTVSVEGTTRLCGNSYEQASICHVTCTTPLFLTIKNPSSSLRTCQRQGQQGFCNEWVELANWEVAKWRHESLATSSCKQGPISDSWSSLWWGSPWAGKSLNPHAPQELPKYLQDPTAISPGFADTRHVGGGSLETILTPFMDDPRKLVGWQSQTWWLRFLDLALHPGTGQRECKPLVRGLLLVEGSSSSSLNHTAHAIGSLLLCLQFLPTKVLPSCGGLRGDTPSPCYPQT